MRIISHDEVTSLLDLDRLVEAVGQAMADLSSGAANVPPRVAARVSAQEWLGAMPVYLPSAHCLACKLVTIFPNNDGQVLPTHQAVIVVFDAATGAPIALLDGAAITAARTAAGSALATHYLARADASILAILGTGAQARSHARALTRLRPWQQIRIAGRRPEKAEALARDLTAELDVATHACASWEEAVAQADVICACTHASEPVVRREWLRPGTHVNSVGFNGQGPEVDPETVRDALLVVESRPAALSPYPVGPVDLNWPLRDGLITPDHVHAELGELVLGTRPGRSSASEITLYKSVGVAVQDAAAAALVLAEADKRDAGVDVSI